MELGKKPLIALPINDINFEKTIQKAKEKPVDLIEMRIDQFQNLEPEYILEKLQYAKKEGFPLIITIRSELEGGIDIPDEKRLFLFELCADYGDILDIELTSKSIRKKVVEIAKKKGILSLVSYHDFEKTPSEEEIQKIIDEAKSLGCDIVKYAFNAKTKEDIARIMCKTNENREKNIVAIAMGDLGKITRVAGFIFGSLITYTYIGQSFAPGQIEIDKLVEEMKFYGIL